MKTLELPPAEMRVWEKLHAMETLWEDQARSERQVKSPGWLFDVLTERGKQLKAGME